MESPIYLETKPRLGVISVGARYAPRYDVSLSDIPKELTEALEKTGYFEVTTEISATWPKESGIAGLRELAARYRVEYLLLYRHHFVKRQRVNGWGWTYPTLIGLFATPSRTLEVAGVMEATLFDVQNGTILFTTYERLRGEKQINIWHNRHKRRELERNLLKNGGKQLADKVTRKIDRLVVARPDQVKDKSDRRKTHRTPSTSSDKSSKSSARDASESAHEEVNSEGDEDKHAKQNEPLTSEAPEGAPTEDNQSKKERAAKSSAPGSEEKKTQREEGNGAKGKDSEQTSEKGVTGWTTESD